MMTNQAVSLIPYIDYGWRDVARDIGQTWLIAALITLIAAILFGDWERHLFISSMTGSIAYLLGFSGVRIFQPSLHMLRWLLVGSAAISSALCWLLAIQVLEDIFSMATNLWLALISVTIWICVALLFYASIRARVMESAFRREQLQNAENRQQLLAAQLKMLQAQIEPHFLFNSLANVRTLIDLDPKMAKLMLDHMNDYLRATLLRTRKGTGTVADEFDLLHHYLSIMQMRMGQRLEFDIASPAEIGRHALPPLLVQPLVENAIKHGLEPKISGGRLCISAKASPERIVIEVSDTGLGLVGEDKTVSVGLSNVRDRLKALYGDSARLTLDNKPSGGVVATLDLPRQTQTI